MVEIPAGKIAALRKALTMLEDEGFHLTVEEAKALTATDPAIKAGRLTMELHPWFGSAALRQVNTVHESIAKTKI